MSNEEKLRELLVKASYDQGFREELLRDPTRTAEKMNVVLPKEYLEKINSTASFISELKAVAFRVPPPIYPPPPYWKWKVEEFRKLIEIIIRDPVLYPPPDLFRAEPGIYELPGRPEIFYPPDPMYRRRMRRYYSR